MRHKKTMTSLSHHARRAARLRVKRFFFGDEGTVTVFATIVFILMVSVGGIAVDIMRFETQRTQMQYTLDRAVLAAASLSQTLEPEEVVESYFNTSGLSGYRLRVNVREDVNFRRVEAAVEMEMQTLFMSLFGQRAMNSLASGTAEDWVKNVEISLALDVSRSMNGRDRLVNLRTAASEFVDTVMRLNVNAENEGEETPVSLSIVPYNATVNMGSALASVFSLTDEHTYSNCARFYDDDFSTGAIDPAVPLQRVGHFDRDRNAVFDPHNPDPAQVIENPDCPTDDTNAILPWSDDATALNQTINALAPQQPWGTAIDTGMRWAVALLDPAARPAVSDLVTEGTINADFNERPADYDDSETLKVIVLMTDGMNHVQFDLQDNVSSGPSEDNFRSGPSPFWRNTGTGALSIYNEDTEQYWNMSRDVWRDWAGGNNPARGVMSAVQLDYADLWNFVPARQLYDALRNEPDPYVQALSEEYEAQRILDTYTDKDGVAGDRRLTEICNFAKASGIVVFTITFEAPVAEEEDADNVMRSCATSDAHYYDVEGTDISRAFASIARSINNLRLIE